MEKPISVFDYCSEKTYAGCSWELFRGTAPWAILGLVGLTVISTIAGNAFRYLFENVKQIHRMDNFSFIPSVLILSSAAIVTALALPHLIALQASSAVITAVAGGFWLAVTVLIVCRELPHLLPIYMRKQGSLA